MFSNNKAKILIFEDSLMDQALLRAALESDYNITMASTAIEGLDFSKHQAFDLFMVDLMLPDKDGFQVCSFLRNQDSSKETPIIVVTSKEEIPDKLMAFNLGADDYITKPYDALELRARVKAKLKHTLNSKKSNMIEKGGLFINLNTQRVSIPHLQIENITFTKIEFNLLVYLASNFDHVLSRDQILETIWGSNLNVSDRTIDTHVSKIRKKLGDYGDFIESVHGTGYRFTTPQIKKSATAG